MTLTDGRGRKAIDGVHGVTERVNVVITKEHRQRLETLAKHGFSAWIRGAIDKAWDEHTKESSK